MAGEPDGWTRSVLFPSLPTALCKHLCRCGFAIGATSNAYLFLLILHYCLFLVPFILLETKVCPSPWVWKSLADPSVGFCLGGGRGYTATYTDLQVAAFLCFSHDRFQIDPPKYTLLLSATCDSWFCQLTEGRGRIFPWLWSTQRLTEEWLLAADSDRFSYTAHCEEISKASHYCLY